MNNSFAVKVSKLQGFGFLWGIKDALQTTFGKNSSITIMQYLKTPPFHFFCPRISDFLA